MHLHLHPNLKLTDYPFWSRTLYNCHVQYPTAASLTVVYLLLKKENEEEASSQM